MFSQIIIFRIFQILYFNILIKFISDLFQIYILIRTFFIFVSQLFSRFHKLFWCVLHNVSGVFFFFPPPPTFNISNKNDFWFILNLFNSQIIVLMFFFFRLFWCFHKCFWSFFEFFWSFSSNFSDVSSELLGSFFLQF